MQVQSHYENGISEFENKFHRVIYLKLAIWGSFSSTMVVFDYIRNAPKK